MSKNIKACLSHNHDNWATPKKLYDLILKIGYIDTFPLNSNYNELENTYKNQKLFINPPFSKLKDVTEWLIKQFKNNNEILLLIPARTDTKYFHKLLELRPFIYFIKGRLHYNESKSAPFPSLLLYFNPKKLTLPLYMPFIQL